MTSLLAPESPFDPPPLLHTILTQPVKTLIRIVDFALSSLRVPPTPGSPPIRIVCISDTHCLQPDHIPSGDLLIHAGDLTNAGTPAEIQSQIDWLNTLDFQHKVIIAGNHDTYLDPRSRQTLTTADHNAQLDWKDLHYLQHSSVTLPFHSSHRDLRIYGAPQIPACGGHEFAFQYPRGRDAWSETVPEDTEILVTHTPPKYHLDLPAGLGCEFLLQEVRRTQPLVHVFGHVHAGRGDFLGWLRGGREVVRWGGETEREVEAALRRPDGFVRGMLDPFSWVGLVRVALYGILDVVWERVWGGSGSGGDGATIMVNASLMFNSTGRLRNPPQVVDV
ncbi:Metallo-dependent phosphatase [Hortaea werneckii]|nr:Metallo-dependent phosphatase [Hortaea werneckii]